MLKTLIFIGAGGFVGSIARYLLSQIIQQNATSSFPWGTLVVNVVGSLLIGLFYGLSERGAIGSSEARLFLTVGLCGGFTTFSTFSNENLALLRDGQFSFFAMYAFASVALGLVAVMGGFALTKMWS
ncbi:MAG TPA: fluoride efflux transporter CrcB [Tenuifilaceae bacterium]|jgi:CrcB protein|nr:fluoride efflux transporter CrcB [Tenuifilaceae bacterium]HPX06348.1 fluoride efflux transporter CrcB [Tenuifilaceae bacterium]